MRDPKEKNLLFLLPVQTQPRYRKRIIALKGYAEKCDALYFERDYFNGLPLPIDSKSVGRLGHGSYVSRLFVLFSAILKIRRESKDYRIIYTFGLDMALLTVVASLGRKIKIVYEVSDINPILLQKNMIGRCARLTERFVTRNIDLLVVTAEKYLTGYFYPILTIPSYLNVLVVENKINLDKIPSVKCDFQSEKIRIGYFGLLRCEQSWRVLSELVKVSNGGIELLVMGKPIRPVDLPAQANEMDGVEYKGEFLWPDDLAAMYGAVDLVWGCFPYGAAKPGNWQWARTNRFYEACFFNKPIITLKDSADAESVELLKIGFQVDLENIQEAVSFLNKKINTNNLKAYRDRYKDVDDSVYLYSNEHELLAKKLHLL